MLNEDISFWFTPRKLLFLSRSSVEFHDALLRSNIIYGGRLMILDTDLIHKSRIRDGLKKKDQFYKGLFNSGLLKIALRQDDNGIVDIGQTAWSIHAPGAAVTEISTEYYSDTSDLTDIVSDDKKIGCYYRLDDAKLRYRAGVIDLFLRLAARETQRKQYKARCSKRDCWLLDGAA